MAISPLRRWWLYALAWPVTLSLAQEYAPRGADDCIVCHGAGMPQDASAILATPHGARSDERAPFAQHQCESCHGPSAAHAAAQSRGENLKPSLTFGVNADPPAGEQNTACLACHDSGARQGWWGSAHEGAEVPCAACHQVHAPRDRVFDALAQQQACFDCHPGRRADTLKPSSHPLRFGAMSCSSCHDPHDGGNEFLLRAGTVNDTCFDCHAEKRGPFLWEHAPAAEDCSLCHRPHGSNHPALLAQRPPLLCQQCHEPLDHPGLTFTAEAIGDELRNRYLLSRGCLNCHSQVHGSNHPSGASLHR